MCASDVRRAVGSGMIVGVSAQTVEQALLAEKNGADYLGVGSVFTTSTKLDAEHVSYDTLKDICRAVSIPVCAIGGISGSNMDMLAGSGIDGVALVSAIFASDDIESECSRLKSLSDTLFSKITHPDISVIQFGGNMKKVLTIAGSDSSGGAGIQADIKTITVHGMFAMSVITAVTAQNTLGVAAIEDISPDCVKSQLDCVFTDIFPDAVKIGMVSNPEIIGVIAERLSFYGARNIVLDPVMVSTSGFSLISQDAKSALVSKLIPMATVITPNIPEAEVLCCVSEYRMKVICLRRQEVYRRGAEKTYLYLSRAGTSPCPEMHTAVRTVVLKAVLKVVLTVRLIFLLWQALEKRCVTPLHV